MAFQTRLPWALLLLIPTLNAAAGSKVADEFSEYQPPALPAQSPQQELGLKVYKPSLPEQDAGPQADMSGAKVPDVAERASNVPVLDLTDMPIFQDEVEEAPAEAPTRRSVHGVVLKRERETITVINEGGEILRWQLPDYAYLIDMAGGGFVEPQGLNKGDFIAVAGQEQGSGRVLIAYLKIGTQPNGNYSDLAPSVEACYGAAVAHLEEDKP